MARIERVEVVPYALRFREPYVTARGRLERREMVLVRIRTDEGVEGLGEAVPLALRGGATVAEVERELRDALTPLAGLDVYEGGAEFEGLSAPAFAAIDTAMIDLGAKLGGRPMWEAMGATEARPLSCNATLVAGAPADVASDAERWAALGFTSFKLKVGVDDDVEQVAAVRSALGDGARIRVDANGVWGPEQAVERLAAMEPQGLELAEQPAAGLEELALVRERTAIPIAADESVAGRADAKRAVELGACSLATVKLSKVGGSAGARLVAAKLPVYMSSALDGPVGIAAAAHTAQALRETGGDAGIPHGLATQELFADTIASRQCELVNGDLQLPDGPGLGVEIDEDALERYRI